jgi:glycosyltransferase involved in cell wall biosynthesis
VVIGEQGPALERFRRHCHSIQVLGVDISNDAKVWLALRHAAREGYDAAFLFDLAKFPVLSSALRRSAARQIVHVGNPVSNRTAERWKQQLRSWLFRPAQALRLAANSLHTLRSVTGHPFYGRFPARASLNCVAIPERAVRLRERCDPVRVGMVARLDAIKDHATLIRATGMLLRQGVETSCELIGRGDLEKDLRDLAAAENVLTNGRVVFTGWLSDVGQALARWDIFVFSTTAREGFGNAAAEAMAHGLPCLFTDVAPCHEVGGDAAAYVRPADPAALADGIVGLARDPARRRALGLAARTRAQACFDAGRKLEDFLSLAFDPTLPGPR